MSSASSRVISTLITIFSGNPELRGLTVEDASVVTSIPWTEGILIGDDGDPDSEAEIEWDQEWADLAHTRRSETGEIPCAVVVQSGITDIARQRVRSADVQDICERIILNNPDLGGLVFNVRVSSGKIKFLQNERGSAVIAPFTVSYWAHV